MTNEEAKSCIGTIEMLRRLAYNIHGVMDVIDAGNCEKIIKVLSDIPKYKDAYGKGWIDGAKASYEHLKMCEEEQEPNTWSLDDAREDFMHDVYNTLDFLPTNEEANRIIDSFDRVTSNIEQEPKTGHCKDCKWWKDSDGIYRRNAKAESDCPFNSKEVYEGTGCCYRFEPQESDNCN